MSLIGVSPLRTKNVNRKTIVMMKIEGVNQPAERR